MSDLDPRALEAAARAMADFKFLNFERSRDLLTPLARAAVTAYLDALAAQDHRP